MRLNINLASRPYEDIRSFTRRWGAIAALLAVFTAALVFYAVNSWRESRDVNQQIATVQNEIRSLDAEKQAGMALLNRPENRITAEQSRFLNQLIVRKAFSWTRVFMDLERMMPPGLHVVSIKPELGPDNQLQVSMIVGGDSRERAIELVRRMEQSPTFKQAQVRAEAAKQNPNEGDAVRFEIASIYVPQAVAESDRAKPAQAGTQKQTKSGAASNTGGRH